MKKKISAFFVIWVIWTLIAGFDVNEMILGAVVALILSLIVSNYINISFNLTIIPQFFKFVFIYIPVFIYKLILSNLDMAYRVLSPKLPINPGIVKISTDLKDDFAKLILANSITLTPGTLTLDIEEDGILVHWVNVCGENADDYKRLISQDFEKLLGGKMK
ncbi:MAG: Na+/H+ antiporter subunit E [Saccharofermentanales bacterium]